MLLLVCPLHRYILMEQGWDNHNKYSIKNGKSRDAIQLHLSKANLEFSLDWYYKCIHA